MISRRTAKILIEWNDQNKYVLELKIKHKSLQKTIEKGLKQTAKYMDRTGANNCHLIIFDKSEDKSWEEKIFKREREYTGKKIVIWGM